MVATASHTTNTVLGELQQLAEESCARIRIHAPVPVTSDDAERLAAINTEGTIGRDGDGWHVLVADDVQAVRRVLEAMAAAEFRTPFDGLLSDRGRRITSKTHRSSTMPNLTKVEGIGPKYAATLAGVGIKTTGALLKKGSTPAGRKEIAKDSGLSPKLILEWINHVDLFRVKGVGEEYADLLEEAGVDTVPELGQRKPENLHAKMAEVNAKKKLVRQLPALSQVEKWVAEAKTLPRVIEY